MLRAGRAWPALITGDHETKSYTDLYYSNDGGAAEAALNGGEVSSQYLKGYPSTS